MKKIAWSEQARADIRRLDRETAMRILTALHRFAETGEGDIKRLKGSPTNNDYAWETTVYASLKSLSRLSVSIRYGIASKPIDKAAKEIVTFVAVARRPQGVRNALHDIDIVLGFFGTAILAPGGWGL